MQSLIRTPDMHTADSLHPGQVIDVRNQGTCIAPQILRIEILWVGPDSVNYRHVGSTTRTGNSTSLGRFLEIVNA